MKFKVDMEDIEANMGYLIFKVLIPFDLAPAKYIERVLDVSNKLTKKPLFQNDYFVTNVKKPTPEQIMTFLGNLPLDKDTRI